MEIGGTLILCLIISFIWGSTNVAIKQSTTEILTLKGNSWFEKFTHEVRLIIFNWKSFIPFFINQTGSVIFYFLLLIGDLSLVIPVTNSLTFLFTALVSTWSGESIPSKRSILGSLFIIFGITLCVVDKWSTQ